MDKGLEELKELVDQEDLSEELGDAIIEDYCRSRYNGDLYYYAHERGYHIQHLDRDSSGSSGIGCYFGRYQLTMY